MSLFYDLNGRRHEISHDEVEAIERTGTPHRVQDYAAGMHGRGYVDVSAKAHVAPNITEEQWIEIDAELHRLNPNRP